MPKHDKLIVDKGSIQCELFLDMAAVKFCSVDSLGDFVDLLDNQVELIEQ